MPKHNRLQGASLHKKGVPAAGPGSHGNHQHLFAFAQVKAELCGWLCAIGSAARKRASERPGAAQSHCPMVGSQREPPGTTAPPGGWGSLPHTGPAGIPLSPQKENREFLRSSGCREQYGAAGAIQLLPVPAPPAAGRVAPSSADGRSAHRLLRTAWR